MDNWLKEKKHKPRRERKESVGREMVELGVGAFALGIGLSVLKGGFK